jgi:hypothetical protein
VRTCDEIRFLAGCVRGPLFAPSLAHAGPTDEQKASARLLGTDGVQKREGDEDARVIPPLAVVDESLLGEGIRCSKARAPRMTMSFQRI